jgi:hypothetical protein
MNHRYSRRSLLARIVEGESHVSYVVDRSCLTPPRQGSFVERYRGTEFESPTPELVVHQQHISRGRSFVIVAGAGAVSLVGMLVAAIPS